MADVGNKRFCLFLLLAVQSLPKSAAVLPARVGLIEQYFNLGLNYSEILLFLGLSHGCFLSIRELKRILRHLGLGRRNHSNPQIICEAIEEELHGSGSMLGYRQMTRRLIHKYGVSTAKETVRQLLKIMDTQGAVESRSKHRLRKRQYRTVGPNHLWHIDGYDKLKPFKFCIHGSIDGYSRRIMWLEVGPTNNDPFVIAQYYLDCVRQTGGIPKIIRAAYGTENVNVALLQRFFHNEEQSFLYGKSSSNQRIEAWWGVLRRGCMDW